MGRKPEAGTTRRPGAVVAALLLLTAALAPGAPIDPAGREYWLSRSGYFRVSYVSRLEPIVINRIHEWVLHVETAAGDVVENAQISIDGGMPAHDHGLPTEPFVSRYLGNGDYLVEGLRFHMQGKWELYFTLQVGDVNDTVIIPLVL